MASSQEKHMPKVPQIIVSIMKDLGILEFDQQVVNQLLEFYYRYTTLLLDDAKTYSIYAKKKNVDVDDVKVAIQLAQDGIFCRPPPLDILMSAGTELNKVPLPLVKPANGLRICSNFLQTNFKLRTDLYSGENIRKSEIQVSAAELLEASRKMEIEDNAYAQSDQIMNNSVNFDLQDMIESSQDSIVENIKEELMETETYEDHSYS